MPYPFRQVNHCNSLEDCIRVRSWYCGCLVTWFCYQLIAKPGNKIATVPWPNPYNLKADYAGLVRYDNLIRYHRVSVQWCYNCWNTLLFFLVDKNFGKWSGNNTNVHQSDMSDKDFSSITMLKTKLSEKKFWSVLLLEWCPACLTHWGRDKMADIFQTIFSNGFSWMKMYEFWLYFTEVCS